MPPAGKQGGELGFTLVGPFVILAGAKGPFCLGAFGRVPLAAPPELGGPLRRDTISPKKFFLKKIQSAAVTAGHFAGFPVRMENLRRNLKAPTKTLCDARLDPLGPRLPT